MGFYATAKKRLYMQNAIGVGALSSPLKRRR